MEGKKVVPEREGKLSEVETEVFREWYEQFTLMTADRYLDYAVVAGIASTEEYEECMAEKTRKKRGCTLQTI